MFKNYFLKTQPKPEKDEKESNLGERESKSERPILSSRI